MSKSDYKVQLDTLVYQAGFEKEEALIATKLNIPKNRNVFTRPRLLAHLRQVTSTRLVLVSAPPGFGKTTLVADWLQTPKEASIGWFLIDEAANDAARFWRYFSQALSIAQGQPGSGLPPNLPLDKRLTYILII